MSGPHSAHQHALWVKFKGCCAYCGCSLLRFGRKPNTKTAATIDHWLPRALEGTNAFENLRLACFTCNNQKADLHPDVWIAIGGMKRAMTRKEAVSRYERRVQILTKIVIDGRVNKT